MLEVVDNRGQVGRLHAEEAGQLTHGHGRSPAIRRNALIVPETHTGLLTEPPAAAGCQAPTRPCAPRLAGRTHLILSLAFIVLRSLRGTQGWCLTTSGGGRSVSKPV